MPSDSFSTNIKRLALASKWTERRFWPLPATGHWRIWFFFFLRRRNRNLCNVVVSPWIHWLILLKSLDSFFFWNLFIAWKSILASRNLHIYDINYDFLMESKPKQFDKRNRELKKYELNLNLQISNIYYFLYI